MFTEIIEREIKSPYASLRSIYINITTLGVDTSMEWPCLTYIAPQSLSPLFFYFKIRWKNQSHLTTICTSKKLFPPSIYLNHIKFLSINPFKLFYNYQPFSFSWEIQVPQPLYLRGFSHSFFYSILNVQNFTLENFRQCGEFQPVSKEMQSVLKETWSIFSHFLMMIFPSLGAPLTHILLNFSFI